MIMERIKLENIDKSEWKLYPFEKIAKRISESIDPKKTDLQVYIGLEHLDSESVHIRRHGVPSDVSGGKLKCYPGDVIFGKRRAYQRKAALVVNEGICSAHSFVFRANDDIIDARLLPWFLHSDQFMHRMVDISVGGLSPTINWSDLRYQEFLLPPKEQQAELADLLWAMDEVIEKDLEMLDKLVEMRNNYLTNEICAFDLKNKSINTILDLLGDEYGLVLLKDVGLFLKGKGIPKDVVTEAGYPCIRYGEIYTTHHDVIRKFKSFIPESEIKNSFRLTKGDIIFAGSGETVKDIGKSVCFYDNFEAYAGGDTIILRSKEYNALFLTYLLNSFLVRAQLDKLGTGATVIHIYPDDLKSIRIPMLSRTVQDELAARMEEIYLTMSNLQSKIQSSRALQKALINQIF